MIVLSALVKTFYEFIGTSIFFESFNLFSVILEFFEMLFDNLILEVPISKKVLGEKSIISHSIDLGKSYCLLVLSKSVQKFSSNLHCMVTSQLICNANLLTCIRMKQVFFWGNLWTDYKLYYTRLFTSIAITIS